jgi:hypothetical protein
MSTRSLVAGLAGVGLLLAATLPTPAAAPPGREQPGLAHRVYPVADLIIPFGGGKTREDCLIRLIQSTISPQAWNAHGGPGSIDFYPIGLALVVRQSPAVLARVDDLLAALRRLQDVEVAVELRIVTVSDACMQTLAVGEGHELQTRVLDDAQVRLLLDAVQADPNGNVLQLPKITMFNGQQGALDLSEKQAFVTGVACARQGDRKVFLPQTKDVNTGLHVSLLPVVSPDNRTVAVQLGMDLGRSDAPREAGPVRWVIRNSPAGQPVVQMPPPDRPRSGKRALRTTVKLSSGQTALLTGWTQRREARELVATPVLSKIPYVNKLFQHLTYGKENEHLLVLMTPRVLVRRGQEERQAPTAEPTPAAPPAPEPAPAAAPPDAPAPAPEPPAPLLHVRRRAFRLDYALDNVGPTGVSKVSLWYTHDAKTWVPSDREVSAKGHLTVTVPQDGRWGFTLIPHSGAGLSAPPPAEGDQPHVWVEVDTAVPQVKILEAAAQLVVGQGVLRVRYRADDDRLAGNPITIFCAPAPEGPWTVLAKDLPCTEEYTRPLAGLPPTFCVRVAAADQAGNVGAAVSGMIHADVKVPTVRAVNVRAEE